MTVAKLIKELEKMPQDYDVMFLNFNGDRENVESSLIIDDDKLIELY